jgi:hypothetical protein
LNGPMISAIFCRLLNGTDKHRSLSSPDRDPQ